MKAKRVMMAAVLGGMLGLLAGGGGAGCAMGAAPGTGGAGGGTVGATLPPEAATAPALDAESRRLLQLLHDRKNTLRDFTARIDYSVYHPATDETGGKRGTLDFLVDPAKGPEFTVDFTINTDEEGKAKRLSHQQIIFDGTNVTTLDFEPRQYMRSAMLPPGSKPGDAVTLNGPMTLPIGIDPEDVARNFKVEVLPADPKWPELARLRLVPRQQSKFDFKRLDIGIDTKLEIPTKLVQTARNNDVTTIVVKEVKTNTGAAKMADPTPPAGWTERK